MKYLKLIITACFAIVALSCKDDDARQKAEALKAAKQSDSILKVVSSNWKFNIPPVSPKVQQRVANWNEWQQFKTELAQKPTGTINAYRQKTKSLINKAEELRNNIPPFFDKPQVRSRIGVVITKIKSLYTYISIDAVPEQKVASLLGEITHETISLQNQLDEIVRISEIPKEIGEEEMLRALDTVRMANPDAAPQPGAAAIPPAERPNSPKPLLNRKRPAN